VETLARSGEQYAAVRDLLADRETWLADLTAAERTDPEMVCAAHARRREER
jgi:hypothetical protein